MAKLGFDASFHNRLARLFPHVGIEFRELRSAELFTFGGVVGLHNLFGEVVLPEHQYLVVHHVLFDAREVLVRIVEFSWIPIAETTKFLVRVPEADDGNEVVIVLSWILHAHLPSWLCRALAQAFT